MSTTIPTSPREPARSTRSSASPPPHDVAATAPPPERVEAIVIDCSTSMLRPPGQVRRGETGHRGRHRRTRRWHLFHRSSPAPTRPCPSIPRKEHPREPMHRPEAAAVRAVDGLRPNGGTAMGTWLALCPRRRRDNTRGRSPTRSCSPTARTSTRHPNSSGEEIGLSEGEFTCDCRGVGTDWHVDELRAISSALLGTVDIVADPADLADDFAAMMRASMSKTIPELTLRLWTPVGARVVFVKQVAPTVEDLTHRRVDSGDQCGEYPLGSWGAEDRDYHIQVEVEPAAVGREKLAARVSVVAGEQIMGEGLVTAVWTADTALSAQISRRVAHYTGQAELAQAVQEGLSARKNGDVVDRHRETAASDGTGRGIGERRHRQAAPRSRRGRRTHGHGPAAPRRRRRRRDGPRCAIDQNRPSAKGGVMPTCPEGHASTSKDYCDVCGSPVRTAAVQPITSESVSTKACPACAAPISGRFCEACGHDSALPEPVPARPTQHRRSHGRPSSSADREFYNRVLAGGGPDTVEFPAVLPGTPNHPAGQAVR